MPPPVPQPSRVALLRAGWRQAVWKITSRCDYGCSYCLDREAPAERPVTPEALLRGLLRHGDRWVLGITGGEPFEVPELGARCRELSRHVLLTVDTHLGLGPAVEDFARQVDPARVLDLHVTLHPAQVAARGGLEPFLERVVMLRERGFPVMVVSVLQPGGLAAFEDLERRSLRRGVHLSPKPLKGERDGLSYPWAYRAAERRFLLRRRPWARVHPFPSRGLPCWAGSRLVRVAEDGTVSRCVGDLRPLGPIDEGFDLADGPRPCAVSRCPCFGLDLLAPQGPRQRLDAVRGRWAFHARHGLTTGAAMVAHRLRRGR
jgi:hypothetical protein